MGHAPCRELVQLLDFSSIQVPPQKWEKSGRPKNNTTPDITRTWVTPDTGPWGFRILLKSFAPAAPPRRLGPVTRASAAASPRPAAPKPAPGPRGLWLCRENVQSPHCKEWDVIPTNHALLGHQKNHVDQKSLRVDFLQFLPKRWAQ